MTLQEPVGEPVPQTTGEKMYPLTLAFQLTKAQANALKRFLTDNNIQYQKIN